MERVEPGRRDGSPFRVSFPSRGDRPSFVTPAEVPGSTGMLGEPLEDEWTPAPRPG